MNSHDLLLGGLEFVPLSGRRRHEHGGWRPQEVVDVLLVVSNSPPDRYPHSAFPNPRLLILDPSRRHCNALYQMGEGWPASLAGSSQPDDLHITRSVGNCLIIQYVRLLQPCSGWLDGWMHADQTATCTGKAVG